MSTPKADKSAADYPNGYIARRWIGAEATRDVLACRVEGIGSIEERRRHALNALRGMIRRARPNAIRLPPLDDDDVTIVEVWL